MALKPDRNELNVDISFFHATGIAYGGERGGWVTATGNSATGPSGAAMDQSVNQVWYGLSATGLRPLGVLLNDVVNIDLTRQSINPFKSEVQVGDKVALLTKGFVLTNRVVTAMGGTPAVAVTVGAPAYTGPSGYITSVATGAIATATGSHVIGKFLSLADEDGYYKVQIDL